MNFKQKMSIHDTMMLIHRTFMEETQKMKQEYPGVRFLKDIDRLIRLMNDMAQLVDKALDN